MTRNCSKAARKIPFILIYEQKCRDLGNFIGQNPNCSIFCWCKKLQIASLHQCSVADDDDCDDDDDDDNDNDGDDEKNKVLRLIPMQTSEMGDEIFSNTSVCAQPPTTGP